MTDIEQKALTLMNAVAAEKELFLFASANRNNNCTVEALCRAIEAHEAFKREVSDAVEGLQVAIGLSDAHRNEKAAAWVKVNSFILPKPVDLLVRAISEATDIFNSSQDMEYADALRQALAAHGLKIVEVT